jgi:hypothetical protein
MNITEETTFRLEVDLKQLKTIKDSLSDYASQWLLFATKSENLDIQKGSMECYYSVVKVRDQFKEHYEKLTDNKDS